MVSVIRVNVITPVPIREDFFYTAIEKALKDTQNRLRKDFERTVSTWSRAVDFEDDLHVRKGDPEASTIVYTEDEIYGYVNNGTRPHQIWAGFYTGRSDKTALAFPSLFVPKTRPGSLRSRPGMRGGDTVYRPFVHHPGTEAREFDEQIKDKEEKWVAKRLEQALAWAIKKSGY